MPQVGRLLVSQPWIKLKGKDGAETGSKGKRRWKIQAGDSVRGTVR